MQTIRIRVDELAGDNGFPVRMFESKRQGDGWAETEVASSSIPEQLAPPEEFDLPPGTKTVDAVRRLLVDPNTDESEAFGKLGTYLYDLLFAGDIGTEWGRAGQGAGGRRLLLDVRPDELARLPWELIRPADRSPLFLDPSSPCARVGAEYPRAEGDLACTPIRRVLVLLGAAPDDAQVAAKQELDQLHEAFLSDAFSKAYGLADIEVLDRPPVGTIGDTLEAFQPHVFHFIGHGDTKRGGELIIAKKDKARGYPWTTKQIELALGRFSPRVAIINACRSQNAEREQQGSWAVSETFVKMGVPAVIAMQGDIRGDAAAQLTRPLYERLSSGVPVDEALAAARAEVAVRLSHDRRDPWLPCLTLTAPPDTVLPRQFAVKPPESKAIVRRFQPLTFFVDNKEHRRSLFKDMTGSTGNGPSVRALAILGPVGFGKTELVRWLLGASALVGGNVAYVDLEAARSDGVRNHDLRTVLAALYTQLCNAPIHGAANKRTLAPFATAAARLIGPNWMEEHRAEYDVETLFTALHKALAGVSPRPTVAIDHAERIDAGHRTVVRDHIVRSAASGELPVLLVVAAETSSAAELLPGEAESDLVRVELEKRKAEEYRELACRYMRASGVPAASFEEFVALAARRESDWPLGELKVLKDFVGGLAGR